MAALMPSGISGWVLIAGNLLPLAGVLLFGWRAADVVLLYWVENLVVGLLNIPRILIARAESDAPAGNTLAERLRANAQTALFFTLHYGLFCAVHGMALIELFGPELLGGDTLGPDGKRGGALEDSGAALLAMMQRVAQDLLVLAGAAALFGSHLVSFFVNYLWQGEYRRVDAGTMMERPYRRIVVVQVFAIGCGALLEYTNSPVAAVAAFVVVKSLIDLHMHGREREALGHRRAWEG